MGVVPAIRVDGQPFSACPDCRGVDPRDARIAELETRLAQSERERIEHARISWADQERAREKRAELERVLVALLDALPRCGRCGALATRGVVSHEPTHCEEHGQTPRHRRRADWAAAAEAAERAVGRRT